MDATAAVELQLHRQTMSSIKRVTLGGVPASFGVVWWLNPYISTLLAGLVFAIVSISGIIQFFATRSFLASNSPTMVRVTLGLVAMSGFGWSLLGFVGIPNAAGSDGTIRILLVISGVVGTSVASSASSRATFFAFIGPMIASIIAGVVMSGREQLILLPISMFVVTIGEAFRASHATTKSAIQLRLEADDLAERLAEALRVTEHDSLHDPLTGAGNRRLLTRHHAEMDQTVMEKKVLTVVCIDLDHFKQVNDQFGHAAGDELLVMATNRIRTLMRAQDEVIRMGGDEFVVILQASREQAEPIAERIAEHLAAPYQLTVGDVSVGASLGLASANTGETLEQVQRRADAALYKAKSDGRGTVTIDNNLPSTRAHTTR